MGKTIREAYGEALVKYGKDDPRVVVLDADVSGSSKTSIFAAACPERFFNVGIAEANMVAMAGGFAREGKIPFANTFAIFISTLGALAARTFGGYGHQNIKLVGAYGGMSDAYDGATHHSVEDVAIMRAIPGLSVFVASDEIVADWLVQNAINTPGPMYIRLSREAMPPLYTSADTFCQGKGKILREGNDATIFACGIMCSIALDAAEQLARENISVRVVDLFTIKPIDIELIKACAIDTRAFVSAEEHSTIGGLGSALAMVMASNDIDLPLETVGIMDCYTESGSYSDLLAGYRLDAPSVMEKVKAALKRTRC